MRFLADGMLGKLARWLRMLGQDVVCNTQLDDNKLLELAKTECRVLLTRDFELYKRAITRCLDAFYIKEKKETKQLSEVAQRYKVRLEIDMDKINCPLCNTKLEGISKEQLKDRLEENTYKFYNKFWWCPKCSQIYWQGSHWKQINQTLSLSQKKSH